VWPGLAIPVLALSTVESSKSLPLKAAIPGCV
jgi:hypothetical protein